MIMLFEDASRKDIQVNMQVEGWVKKRNIYESSTRRIKLANRVTTVLFSNVRRIMK